MKKYVIVIIISVVLIAAFLYWKRGKVTSEKKVNKKLNENLKSVEPEDLPTSENKADVKGILKKMKKDEKQAVIKWIESKKTGSKLDAKTKAKLKDIMVKYKLFT